MKNDAATLPGVAGPIEIARGDSGVTNIKAASLDDALAGLGFCHARDRGLQMLLVRILGRGQASEHLQADDESLDLDRFFRSLNLARDVQSETAALSARARAGVEAYCRGANLFFERRKIPWELRLFGYSIDDDPWSVADIFLTAKIGGYVSLAQSQGEMERFIVECVQQGVPRGKLEELFPGKLNGLDEDLIRQVKLQHRLIPESVRWASALPRMMASNNWVVSGSKSHSGLPLLANDPHLEVNRLPPIWYEAMLRWRAGTVNRYAMGATMPGVPGVIVGRNTDLAWGVTYAFMDCIDSWIEDCRDGKYRRGEEWIPFSVRNETIRRKKKSPVEVSFYENPHGLLDGDPNVAGHYLSTRWSCGEETSAASLAAAFGVLEARTVEEGRQHLGQLTNSSWNWVLADRAGAIGYQMSGKMPLRREGISGLVPLPGWDGQNDWRGFAAPEQLPRLLNPPEGFIATANNDLNRWGSLQPINLPMASYRAERIEEVLAEEKRFDVEDMKALQFDFYSTQAERFMSVIKPLLSRFAQTHSTAVQVLNGWDFTYRNNSIGAFLFEEVYRALLDEVFASQQAGFGAPVLKQLVEGTSLFADFYGNFDQVLLSEESAWFDSRSRDEIYTQALKTALATPLQAYGETRKITMRHLLFGGRLPGFLGFDHRPITLPGNRATVHQGQIYRPGGRDSSFAPSIRLVADLATDELHTTLAGGASDRRFSKWYTAGIDDWLHGRYKVLSGKAPV